MKGLIFYYNPETKESGRFYEGTQPEGFIQGKLNGIGFGYLNSKDRKTVFDIYEGKMKNISIDDIDVLKHVYSGVKKEKMSFFEFEGGVYYGNGYFQKELKKMSGLDGKKFREYFGSLESMNYYEFKEKFIDLKIPFKFYSKLRDDLVK